MIYLQLKQRFYDRAVFTIGDVQGGVTGGAEADYQIVIEYEVVYVSAAGNADMSEQSMGSGMEYDGGNYIWISICSINIRTSAGVNNCLFLHKKNIFKKYVLFYYIS
jgi:hypothetical protein